MTVTDRDSPTAQDGLTVSSFVMVAGVKWPLLKQRGSVNWRLRKRTRHHKIDIGLGVSVLSEAKKKAKRIIETNTAKEHRLRSGGATLRELCNDYLRMPRECRDYVAAQNITYLAMIIRETTGKTLEEAHVSDLSSGLWIEFARKRQDGNLQYAIPREGNAGINSAVRSARSIFAKALEREYEAHGHRIDFADLRRWKPLKELKTAKAGEPKELVADIRALREAAPLMWRAVGLARFAGLRQHEIQHAQRHWLRRDDKGNTLVIIQHRPEERFYAKSDEPRESIILDAVLADDLWKATGLLAPHPEGRSRTKWFDRDLNAWVRRYVPTGKGAMHRLRGYYADEVKRLTEDAFAARLEGIRAAQESLGHKDQATTVKHYLAKGT